MAHFSQGISVRCVALMNQNTEASPGLVPELGASRVLLSHMASQPSTQASEEEVGQAVKEGGACSKCLGNCHSCGKMDLQVPGFNLATSRALWPFEEWTNEPVDVRSFVLSLPNPVPATLLLIHLANSLGKQQVFGACVPCTHMGDSEETPASWLQPSSSLVIWSSGE